MTHEHGTAAGAHRGRLAAVLAITVGVLIAEILGAVLSGSLALLADAGHVAADATGIGLALFAIWMADRPATSRRTFGYQRAEILAALANGVILLGLAGYIGYEAVHRLVHPAPVRLAGMAAFGLLAVLGNAVSLLLLASGRRESLNIRGAFLEVAADLLGALAVLVAAAIMSLTGFTRADPIASLAIATLIVPRTLRLVRDAVDVLLEAAPHEVDLDEVRRHLLSAPGVRDVHDLHAWTITSGVPVMSAHVVVDDQVLADGGYGRLLDRLHDCLTGHFDVEHSTLQLEPAGHVDHEGAKHRCRPLHKAARRPPQVVGAREMCCLLARSLPTWRREDRRASGESGFGQTQKPIGFRRGGGEPIVFRAQPGDLELESPHLGTQLGDLVEHAPIRRTAYVAE
jgi:cobalt-zinc-cadmium efflux system protein